MIGDPDISWVFGEPTIQAPLPYSVRVRRRTRIIFTALALLSIIGGALYGFNH